MKVMPRVKLWSGVKSWFELSYFFQKMKIASILKFTVFTELAHHERSGLEGVLESVRLYREVKSVMTCQRRIRLDVTLHDVAYSVGGHSTPALSGARPWF